MINSVFDEFWKITHLSFNQTPPEAVLHEWAGIVTPLVV